MHNYVFNCTKPLVLSRASFSSFHPLPLSRREGGTSGGEDTVEQGLFVVQTAVDMLNNNMFKDVVSFLKPK